RGQRSGRPSLADPGLRLRDRILDPPEGRPAPAEVEEEPRGARVAVAGLAHRAGVEQPPSPSQVELGSRGGEAAAELHPGEHDAEGDVRVTDEDERLSGQLEGVEGG